MNSKLLSMLIWACFLGGCSPAVSYREIKRIASPDSIVDAVLVQTNTSATTSYRYNVYICAHGHPFKKGSELVIADHIDSLYWSQVYCLEIHYSDARIFHFTNFWNSQHLAEINHNVTLRLVQSMQLQRELLGTWFVPHDATTNIHFFDDKTFQLNDFVESDTLPNGAILPFEGSYAVHDSPIVLTFAGHRPEDTLRIKKLGPNDEDLYLRSTSNPNNYFVRQNADN
jgi:hypothetical protein